MTPSRFVWLATAAFASGFSALAVLRHRAFGSGRFDLGNMIQAVWSTANGDVLSVTDVHGEQISRLGSHFDPILVLLAPLWSLWPSPEAAARRPGGGRCRRSASGLLARAEAPRLGAGGGSARASHTSSSRRSSG